MKEVVESLCLNQYLSCVNSMKRINLSYLNRLISLIKPVFFLDGINILKLNSNWIQIIFNEDLLELLNIFWSNYNWGSTKLELSDIGLEGNTYIGWSDKLLIISIWRFEYLL